VSVERLLTALLGHSTAVVLITRYVPEVSALAANPDVPTEVDAETKDLLKSLGMDSLPVNVTNVTSFVPRERKGRYIPGAGRA